MGGRLFGDTQVVTEKIGEVTQGIGFDQLPVQEQAVAAPTRIVNETIASFETIVEQSPTGLGSAGAIFINYGAGGNSSGNEFTVSPTGDIIANANALGIEYRFRIGVRIGRSGAAGLSIPLIRFLYAADGSPGSLVQIGGTFGVEVDDPNTTWREVFDLNFAPAVGSLIRVEFARDEAGTDSGSLQAPQPTATLAGWNPVASSRLEIIRQDLV